jgi:hypothetical protein
MDPAQRGADRAALQAIALFHLASRPPCGWPETTCECSGSPDIYVIERGEPADALYLILNGTADALRERSDGQVTHLRRMHAGDFFGELGLVAGRRTAHVVARESLTCLVMFRAPVRPDAGRGAGASSAAELPAAAEPPGTRGVDVTSYLHRKLEALARHRTQYPIVPSMLPQRLLEQMLGTEFFRRAAATVSIT